MQGNGSGRRAAFRYRAAGVVLVVAYLAFVCWLSARPVSVPWVASETVEPLGTIRSDLALGPWEAARSLGGGLLLLAPLGVLLPLAGGRVETSGFTSLARTVFTGAMVSLVIGMSHSQATGQVISMDGLLLNTTGVALAHLAVVPGVRAFLRRRGRRGRPTPLRHEEGPHQLTATLSRVAITPWDNVLTRPRS
ncbi:hypothetical protein ACZ90_31155 [Streptomyces albus subsp. albus]|nr:hypothetical protein ACZ90_31155 [Streptomyces albus subsp. albus]